MGAKSRSKPNRALIATAQPKATGRSPSRVTWAPTTLAGRKCDAAHCMRTRSSGSVLSESQTSWNQRSDPRSTRPPPEAHSMSVSSGWRSATVSMRRQVARAWSTQ